MDDDRLDSPFEDFGSARFEEDEEKPYWTAWRIIYLIVALLLIAALLAALLWPVLLQIAEQVNPPPLPTRPVTNI